MKRFLLAMVGAVLLLVSLLGAAGVGWVLSVFGTDGRYEVPVANVDVTGAALYVNLFNVNREASIPDGLLDTYVEARGEQGRSLFIGVGEQQTVQDFLLGVPYEAASELAGGQFVTRPVPGLKVPAPDPTAADIWSIQAVGTAPRLLWTDEAGAGVFVLMNADGSPGVAAELTASLENPRLIPATLTVAGLSLILAILGVILLAKASRKDAAATHR